eukprot:maker-scaffold_33-snap-gene-1.50-mRNA-1 protein AED:0.71 eAED:0.71 QI:0/0/0/1/1/1/2/0/131
MIKENLLDCIESLSKGKINVETALEIIQKIISTEVLDKKLNMEILNTLNNPDWKVLIPYLKMIINNLGKVATTDEKKFRLNDDQVVTPVYSLSGAFRGPELSWSVSEKEMIPIIKALLRFEYMTSSTIKPI